MLRQTRHGLEFATRRCLLHKRIGYDVDMATYGFYLETEGIEGADFSTVEEGNPGCGGTQFATIALAHELQKAGNSVTLYLTASINYSSNLDLKIVKDFVRAVEHAILNNVFLVFTAPRELSPEMTKALDVPGLKAIAWMHIDPLPKTLQDLSSFESIRAFVTLGERQLIRYLNSPISKKLIRIRNGQYISSRACRQNPEMIITYIGALVPQKGFHFLAEAWPMVVSRYPHAILNVIGSGNLHNYKLNSLGKAVAQDEYFSQILSLLGDCADSVRFHGRVSAKEKEQIVARTLIGVVNPTGNTENCPASALDFQAAGVPVLAGKKRGNIDVIQDRRTGWLISVSPRSLGKKMVKILGKDAKYLDSMSEHCIDFVKSEFNFSQIVDEWEKLESDLKASDTVLKVKIPHPKNFIELVRITLYLIRSLNRFLPKKF
jgi:glycosyltransferase involved in cell wall biosynthesis